METTMNDRILEAALKGFVKEASPELEFLRRRSVEVQERMVERILATHDSIIGKRPVPTKPKYYHRPAIKPARVIGFTRAPSSEAQHSDAVEMVTFGLPELDPAA